MAVFCGKMISPPLLVCFVQKQLPWQAFFTILFYKFCEVCGVKKVYDGKDRFWL